MTAHVWVVCRVQDISSRAPVIRKREWKDRLLSGICGSISGLCTGIPVTDPEFDPGHKSVPFGPRLVNMQLFLFSLYGLWFFIHMIFHAVAY